MFSAGTRRDWGPTMLGGSLLSSSNPTFVFGRAVGKRVCLPPQTFLWAEQLTSLAKPVHKKLSVKGTRAKCCVALLTLWSWV